MSLDQKKYWHQDVLRSEEILAPSNKFYSAHCTMYIVQCTYTVHVVASVVLDTGTILKQDKCPITVILFVAIIQQLNCK